MTAWQALHWIRRLRFINGAKEVDCTWVVRVYVLNSVRLTHLFLVMFGGIVNIVELARWTHLPKALSWVSTRRIGRNEAWMLCRQVRKNSFVLNSFNLLSLLAQPQLWCSTCILLRCDGRVRCTRELTVTSGILLWFTVLKLGLANLLLLDRGVLLIPAWLKTVLRLCRSAWL